MFFYGQISPAYFTLIISAFKIDSLPCIARVNTSRRCWVMAPRADILSPRGCVQIGMTFIFVENVDIWPFHVCPLVQSVLPTSTCPPPSKKTLSSPLDNCARVAEPILPTHMLILCSRRFHRHISVRLIYIVGTRASVICQSPVQLISNDQPQPRYNKK